MVEMASGLLISCFFSLFFSEMLSAGQAVDVRFCADMAYKHNNGHTNFSAVYVKQLLECLQIQQSALEETSLNLTSLIVNLKSSKEKRYIFHRFEMNWTEAVESCTSEGQQLATIRNKHEHDKFVADMPKGSQMDTYWLGGFDPTNTGQFVWLGKNGKDTEPLSYSHWAQRQPRRTCDTQYDECISSSFNAWAVTSCYKKHFYACEFYSVPLQL